MLIVYGPCRNTGRARLVKGQVNLDGDGHEIWTLTDGRAGRWRPLNGGLTLMTRLLGGARFVDGIYIPADAVRPSDPEEEVSAA